MRHSIPWSVAKVGLSNNQQKWHAAGISHYRAGADDELHRFVSDFEVLP